jgi:SAM-dependent methyltransferase
VGDYRDLNRAMWDERVAAHAASVDYAVERFVDDPSFLSGVVRFDMPRLGDIRGLETVHLQCHIGTDSISLARLGAHVTGLDFSQPAIEHARLLSQRSRTEASFVTAEVYDAPRVLGASCFDLVYTGIGALCWLPDIRRWADVVATLLRPGGSLFLREGHPVLWALSDARQDGLLALEYPYFEQEAPLVFDEGGTYVATDTVFQTTLSHEWNHGLGETVAALLAAGMELTMLEEHDTVHWNALPGRMEQIDGDGWREWRLIDRPERLPHTYTLRARLPIDARRRSP